MVEPERPQITIRRMRVARWISRVTRMHAQAHTHAPHTHTHTQIEICNIVALPRQQWFRERESTLPVMF